MAQYNEQQQMFRLGAKDASTGRAPLWPLLKAAERPELEKAYKDGYHYVKSREI
jgi:hypothetical protein